MMSIGIFRWCMKRSGRGTIAGMPKHQEFCARVSTWLAVAEGGASGVAPTSGGVAGAVKGASGSGTVAVVEIDRWVVPPAVAAAVFAVMAIAPPVSREGVVD